MMTNMTPKALFYLERYCQVVSAAIFVATYYSYDTYRHKVCLLFLEVNVPLFITVSLAVKRQDVYNYKFTKKKLYNNFVITVNHFIIINQINNVMCNFTFINIFFIELS